MSAEVESLKLPEFSFLEYILTLFIFINLHNSKLPHLKPIKGHLFEHDFKKMGVTVLTLTGF